MKNQFTQEQISETAVRLGIPDHPFVARRIARAYDLVATNKISEISHDGGLYRVRSQYEDKIYTVELNHGKSHCTCPDNERTIFCKHMIASMMTAFERERKASVLTVKETPNPKVKASWVVTDGNEYTNVWQDLNGKICCVCGAYYKRDCIHKQAIRDYYDGGNGSKIANECGTETAKELQDRLNGANGTGDTQSPFHHQLDTNDPFQECEQLDIDQIEGRSNGDLVHVLSNGEYVISYRGIMKLAAQHGMTFEASRHDETHTVIAYGRCGSNSRASGKPINGAEMTALELAKRNTARQLLPLPEIKALEHKVKLEVEFNWQVAKRKCLEIVPDFTFDILIDDLIKAGTLRQAHSSDYSRREWILIFDACRKDSETNGHDDKVNSTRAIPDSNDGGDNTPSSEQQVSCAICSRTLTNPESVRLQVGPICREKIGIKGEAHLHGNIISEELLQASELYSDEALRKRIIKACLTLDAPLPVKVLNWLGNEYFSYRNRPILYYICAAGQLNRLDTHRRKLRHVIVTSETAETELDAHALAQMAADVAEPSERSAGIPQNEEEFIAKCKQAEEESADDVANDTNAMPFENANGKRKLQMGKDRIIWLIEVDGTKKQISYPEAGKINRNSVLRLTQGIACGADISTVELSACARCDAQATPSASTRQ